MLQHHITAHTTLTELHQALASGAQWLQVVSNHPQLEAVVEACREAGVILVVEDDIEALERYRMHGILLNHADAKRVAELRQRLGAHPIIGVKITEASDLPSLCNADIDYLLFEGAISHYAALQDALTNLALDLPLVLSTEAQECPPEMQNLPLLVTVSPKKSE